MGANRDLCRDPRLGVPSEDRAEAGVCISRAQSYALSVGAQCLARGGQVQHKHSPTSSDSWDSTLSARALSTLPRQQGIHSGSRSHRAVGGAYPASPKNLG